MYRFLIFATFLTCHSMVHNKVTIIFLELSTFIFEFSNKMCLNGFCHTYRSARYSSYSKMVAKLKRLH